MMLQIRKIIISSTIFKNHGFSINRVAIRNNLTCDYDLRARASWDMFIFPDHNSTIIFQRNRTANQRHAVRQCQTTCSGHSCFYGKKHSQKCHHKRISKIYLIFFIIRWQQTKLAKGLVPLSCQYTRLYHSTTDIYSVAIRL